MSILESYPKAKVDFLDWMMTTYGRDEHFFNQAPFKEQCIAIARYLGYPVVFPANWTNDQIKKKIHNYLYLYEVNLRTFPHGVSDPIKELEKMDYIIRDEKFSDKNERINVLPGLNAALVKRTDSQINSNIEEKKEEESIYTTDYSRQDEDPPF